MKLYRLRRRPRRARHADRGRVRVPRLAVRLLRTTAFAADGRDRRGRPVARPRPAVRRSGRPAGAIDADRAAVHGDELGRAIDGDRVVLRAAGPDGLACDRRARPGDRARSTVLRRAIDDASSTRRTSRSREPVEFPTTGGRTATACSTRRANRRFARPDRRAAAAHRDQPRRPDRGGLARRCRSRPSCSRAAASPCSTSTTAARPATAATTASGSRASGASSTSTTASTARAALAERGLVDRDRLAIRGGSASGYTTLCALTFRDEFRAGVQLLRHRRPRDVRDRDPQVRVALPRTAGRAVARGGRTCTASGRRSTSRRADHLPGPDPAGRRRPRSCRRSRPSRSWTRSASSGVPHAYLLFEGEDHGFRRPRTSSARSRRSSRSTARSSASRRPTRSSRSKIEFLDAAGSPAPGGVATG